DCVYSDGLEYHPVSHLIVHHTVSNNGITDWPATVRAIWNFHTYSRGWGDVGYNYLIDPNGVIYEGHYGGDNVVGTHAAGANKGSMAASLLGTFTAAPSGIKPPPAMLNAAVELLAWKADQRGINVFDASRTLPNISWGLPHLMGHRDVYGTTECPGDQAHLLIPWLRNEIAGRLGRSDPFIYADDATGTFTRSSTGNWYAPPYLCGFNNHAWYTWSTSNPALSTNWGEWRPNVPATGRYRIDVYVPYCRTGRNETGSATYTIHHADGTSTRTVNQQANVGLWITLGEYNLRQGNGNVIRLTDITGDNDLGVWFDAVRLLPLSTPPPPPPPVATNVAPTTNIWKTDRAVAFTWQVTNPETVQFTTLQVAVDYGFTNVLINQSWWGVVTSHSHTFGADYADLYWRVLLSRESAPLISSRPTRFSLDATPPQSAVNAPIFFLTREGRYHVNWSGRDALSGLDRYQVDVRAAGSTGWTSWLSNTRLTSAQFAPPNPALVYEFRAYGVDVAGNVERAPDGPDATTRTAVPLRYTLFQPFAVR
uniref:golvesin C-terminal-like domain-containing protein n=1 Tax=Promineifilum sp. TaxID=2664178 RepID=UPI0035B21E17